MRPYRAKIGKALDGGFPRIFSKLPLSRVLRVGHEKTARLALDAASVLGTLPASIPGAGALAPGWTPTQPLALASSPVQSRRSSVLIAVGAGAWFLAGETSGPAPFTATMGAAQPKR